MILITGASGLLGRQLSKALTDRGLEVRPFDIRRDPSEDTRCPEAVRAALTGVEGIVHLAAVSRVVWAERHPSLAASINVEALRTLLREASDLPTRPWIVFASSREVYGDQPVLPVPEDAPFRPLNAYARTKVEGERLVAEARSAGFRVAVCRFSNVFGSPEDHADRVAVAFARTAAGGGRLRVEGGGNTFDFTYVDDVVRGLATLVEATRRGETFPPIHFVSGRGTTLSDLAALARSVAGDRRDLDVAEAPPRSFDVARFVGDPERARALIGWTARIPLETGFRRLVRSVEARGHAGTPPWLDVLTQSVSGN